MLWYRFGPAAVTAAIRCGTCGGYFSLGSSAWPLSGRTVTRRRCLRHARGGACDAASQRGFSGTSASPSPSLQTLQPLLQICLFVAAGPWVPGGNRTATPQRYPLHHRSIFQVLNSTALLPKRNHSGLDRDKRLLLRGSCGTAYGSAAERIADFCGAVYTYVLWGTLHPNGGFTEECSASFFGRERAGT